MQFFWTKFRDFFEASGFDILISEIKKKFGLQKTAEMNANHKNFNLHSLIFHIC